MGGGAVDEILERLSVAPGGGAGGGGDDATDDYGSDEDGSDDDGLEILRQLTAEAEEAAGRAEARKARRGKDKGGSIFDDDVTYLVNSSLSSETSGHARGQPPHSPLHPPPGGQPEPRFDPSVRRPPPPCPFTHMRALSYSRTNHRPLPRTR